MTMRTLMVIGSHRAVDQCHPVHFVEYKPTKRDTRGPGGDQQQIEQRPGPSIYGQILC